MWLGSWPYTSSLASLSLMPLMDSLPDEHINRILRIHEMFHSPCQIRWSVAIVQSSDWVIEQNTVWLYNKVFTCTVKLQFEVRGENKEPPAHMKTDGATQGLDKVIVTEPWQRSSTVNNKSPDRSEECDESFISFLTQCLLFFFPSGTCHRKGDNV